MDEAEVGFDVADENHAQLLLNTEPLANIAEDQ
jgi:hypothetical protein